MQLRPALVVPALLVALAVGDAAGRDPAAKGTASGTAQQATLNQMAEFQKWSGEQLWHIREQVEALPRLLDEVKDGNAATQEEIARLREDVKGLYVEISDAKERVEGLKDDIAGVDANVYRSRTYAGFFLALMLLMVALIFVMTIRR